LSNHKVREKKSNFDLTKLLELSSYSINVPPKTSNASQSVNNNNTNNNKRSSSSISDENKKLLDLQHEKETAINSASCNLMSDSYLLNQAIIFKKISDYNSKQLGQRKYFNLASTQIINDSATTTTVIKPKKSHSKIMSLNPFDIEKNTQHKNEYMNETDNNNNCDGIDKSKRLFEKQVDMANEFNMKIKQTNKKLDDLNKKLSLYKNSLKSARINNSSETQSSSNSHSKETEADKQPSSEIPNTEQKFQLYNSIIKNNRELSSLNNFDKEDLEFEVEDEEIEIDNELEPPLIPNEKEDYYEESMNKKIENLYFNFINIEPCLPKSNMVYKAIATSTTLLQKPTTQQQQHHLKYSSSSLTNINRKYSYEDEEVLDACDDDVSSSLVESDIEVKNSTKKINTNNDFIQCESEVMRLQKQVLIKMQQAINSGIHGIDLPSNSNSLLNYISNSYNSAIKSKMDVYKFYERSTPKTVQSTAINNSNNLMSSSSNKQHRTSII
jgi:hypothetical protein